MGWGLLIGLIGIAISIYFGLSSISKWLVRKHDLLAINYALIKAISNKKKLTVNDIEDGYKLANDLFGK